MKYIQFGFEKLKELGQWGQTSTAHNLMDESNIMAFIRKLTKVNLREEKSFHFKIFLIPLWQQTGKFSIFSA
ncbi:MAG: hypothetical protein MJZ80_05755 [Treponema sp.]|nr:hypothetical protein [Treponema sp.]